MEVFHVYELTGPCLDIDAVLFIAAEIRIQGLGWPPIYRPSCDLNGEVFEGGQVGGRPH